MVCVDNTFLPVTSQTYDFDSPSYIYTEAGMGYAFLSDSHVVIERAPRQKNTFLQIAIEHGESPAGDSYAYVMLPNSTFDEVRSFSTEQDIEIIAATDQMHAIKDLHTGTVYANVFSPGMLEGIMVRTPCSLMYSIRQDGGLNVSVSVPDLENDTVVLQLPDHVQLLYGEDVSVNGEQVVVDFKKDKTAIQTFVLQWIS